MEIERNIPISPKGNYWTKDYNFISLKVNESVLVKGVKASSVSCHLNQLQHKYRCKFTTRKDGENVRVWRIEIGT